jgi:putative acetyltransferase
MNLQEKITAVHAEEFPRLVEIWELAVRQTHHFLSESDIAYFKPLVRDQFLYMVDLVAIRDKLQKVLGFAGVAEGKLEMLFVDPLWHGQGYGARLLRHAVENMKAHLVDVNEQNPQAVGFYQRRGAVVIGRSEQDSMGKPFPLLHMRLPEYKKEFS